MLTLEDSIVKTFVCATLNRGFNIRNEIKGRKTDKEITHPVHAYANYAVSWSVLKEKKCLFK